MLRRDAANERLQKINPAALWGEASEMGCRLLAQTGCWRLGRACPLCPGISDINLFRYRQGIIYFDSQISDRAFDLGVTEQKLDSPEISRAPIDQGSFSASQRMRPKQPWVQPNAPDPVPVGNSILLATDIESGDAPALCQRSVA
jgi:hypothetical protein